MEIEEELIIDTDVLIALVKDHLLDKFLLKFYGYITIITLYEYMRGRAYFGHPIEEEKKYIENMFDILNINNEVAKKICEIYVDLRKRGELISDPDLINAAIAITNEIPLATNNLKHYKNLQRYKLKIIPWNALKKVL